MTVPYQLLMLLVLSTPLLSALSFGFSKTTFGGKPSILPFYLYASAIVALSFPLYSNTYSKYFLAGFKLATWFDTSYLEINWSFIFDPLTYFMYFIVLIISFLVHIYSLSYMQNDPALSRFLSFLSLFTFFMLFLVSSENLVQLFIGWEGVGLCSFLLISFWTERIPANKAAIKAMVVNKIGDCFYLMGTALFIYHYNSASFAQFYYLSTRFVDVSFKTQFFFGSPIMLVTLSGLFFFVAVMSKSAQFGFHTWLPDAMEGPTPVSALIHAATMVTAGVFLLVRLSFFFQLSSSLQSFVLVIGLLTMVFAASVALFQSDIKKVIAYSTCSQLGYMVAACGLSFYGAAFFHLLSHAFFKALLFLCAGAVIHFFNDEQDMRRMGGAFSFMPFTFVAMLIASLALLGFPFTSGYYSKDRLLEFFFLSGESYFVFFVGFFVACLTSFYSFRVLYMVFFNKPAGYKINYLFPHNLDKRMVFVFTMLLLLTLGFGYWFSAKLVWLPFDFVLFSLHVPLYIKLLPLASIFVGWIVVHLYYYNTSVFFFFNETYYFVYDFLIKKWYIDILYNYYFVRSSYFASSFSFFFVEKGWIEFLGPTGLRNISMVCSKLINNMQTSNFFDYLFYFLITFLVFLLLI